MDPIRMLIVAPDEARSTVQELATHLEGVEIVGVAYNLRTAKQILDRTQPELLLVDVMLQGLRSVDVTSYASTTLPDLGIFALIRARVDTQTVPEVDRFPTYGQSSQPDSNA